MFLKNKLSNWVYVMTIGLCSGLANASNHSNSECSDKDLKKFYNLMSLRDTQFANRDSTEAQKFQNEMDKMESCVQRHKKQTREEADKLKKNISKKN